MSCARCGGLLVNEFIVDPIEGSHSGFHGQRCLNCGTIVDEVIGENRRFHCRANVTLSSPDHACALSSRISEKLTKRYFQHVTTTGLLNES